MLDNIATMLSDDRIVQLVGSGLTSSDDGNVEVYLLPDATEQPTTATSLRFTDDDALALADALRHAAGLVAGSEPQAFIRVVIVQPQRGGRRAVSELAPVDPDV